MPKGDPRADLHEHEDVGAQIIETTLNGFPTVALTNQRP